MSKFSRTVFVTSCLLLFFSCGRNNNSSTSSVIAQSSADRYNNNPQQNSVVDDLANKPFLVPPEIAILEATVLVRGTSFTEVASLVEANSSQVIKSISQVKGCSASIINYQHPKQIYEKRIGADSPLYGSSSNIKAIIAFEGMNSVEERIDRLNNCLQAIPKLSVDNLPKNTTVSLSLSEAVPTVKNIGLYREQILKTKFDRLQQIANLAETPSQFNVSDTKCTSNGTVFISDRTLSNLKLDVDFQCIQFGK